MAALLAEAITDELVEADTPYSDYGYWITPEGGIIPVPHQRHEETLARTTDSELVNYWEAFREGWLRIVAHKGQFALQTYNVECMTVRGLGALRRLALLGGYDTYTTDLLSNGTYNAGKTFTDPQTFLAYVNGARQKVLAARQAGTRVVNEHFLGEAAAIPETPYGYWIDNNGEFIVVNGPNGHLNAIRKLGWVTYGEAFQHGWVRIVSELERRGAATLSINFDRGLVGARAAGAVRRLVRSKTFEQFFVDVGPEEGGDFKTIADEQSFMRFFNQCRQPIAEQQLDEAKLTVPPTDYGYWIKPDGEIIVVTLCDHIDIASRESNGELRSYEDAFAAGWVRIYCRGNLFAANTDSPAITTQAMAALRAMLRAKPYQGYEIEFGSDYKSFDEPKACMAYIRRRRQDEVNQHMAETLPLDEAALMEEKVIPRTDYGYWIKPDGEMVVVPPGQHITVLEFESGGKWQDYKYPLGAGWIRVVAADGFCIAHFQRGKPSARAASSMRAIAGQGFFYAFEVEVIGAREDYKEFDNPKAFMNFITAARQPTSV